MSGEHVRCLGEEEEMGKHNRRKSKVESRKRNSGKERLWTKGSGSGRQAQLLAPHALTVSSGALNVPRRFH